MGQGCMKNHYICETCEADFEVKHEMDESFYEVHFCPFCGAQVNKEEEDDYPGMDAFPSVDI